MKLSLSGFPPAIGVAFRQCVASPSAVATGCTAVNTQVIGITDSTGSAQTYLPVYAGSNPLLANSGGTGSITCDASHPCVIAAMHDVNDLTKAVFAPITFGPAPDACPSPGANEVVGSGSASAYRAIYAWESTVCLPPASLPIGYTLGNSVDGWANFFNGLSAWGAVGPLAPITPPSTTLTYKLAPLSTSAVVLAYRIYDRRGPQITTLTLTPELAAQIYLGQIPNWSANGAINSLNPGQQFPGRVVPFARAEHSSETYVFTSWLAANAPTVWTSGPQEIFPLPPSGVTGITGSAGVGLAVVDPTTVFFDQGNIGFMDASTAAFYGLPTAQIMRADGSSVSATPATITQAIADATANADGTVTPNYATTDPLAYPMPLPTYMVAPTNTISTTKGGLLAAFLRYAVQSGQLSLPPGYAPLPPSLVTQSLAVAKLIPAPGPVRPSPTPPAYVPPPLVVPPYIPPPVGTPAPNPSPTPDPTCIAQPSPSPSASPSPPATPSPSASPTASPSPAASPSPTPVAVSPGDRRARHDPPMLSPCAGPGTASGDFVVLAAQQGKELLMLIQFDDPSASSGFLSSIAGLGLLLLGAGIALQVLGRRRRVVAPPPAPNPPESNR